MRLAARRSGRLLDEEPEDHGGALLVERAIRRELRAGDDVRLQRHVAACRSCAAELEAARVFDAFLAPGRLDQALSWAAVEGALARIDRRRFAVVDGRRRFGRRAGVAALGIAAAAAALFGWGPGRSPSRRPDETPPPARAIALPDGSEVPPDPGTEPAARRAWRPGRTAVRPRPEPSSPRRLPARAAAPAADEPSKLFARMDVARHRADHFS